MLVVLHAGASVIQSPLSKNIANSRWRIRLNVGREPGSAMPVEWASSGARLALSVDLKFDASNAPADSMERLLGPSEDTQTLRLASDVPSFVGASGLVDVPVNELGAWRATSLDNSLATSLRFYLDFPEGAQRNDVELPAGRVFFTGNAWDDEDLERAEAEMARLQAGLDAQREEIKVRTEASRTGGPLGRVQAVRAAVLAQDEVVRLRARLQGRAAGLPDDCGVCDGPKGLKLAAKGMLTIKARGGLLGLSEFYYIIGRYEVVRCLDLPDDS